MNKIFKLFGLVCITLLVFSCTSKQDDNGDLLFGVQYPNNNGSNGKLLTKVTSVDASGNQTITTYSYINKKLSAAKITEGSVTTDVAVLYDNGLMSNINTKKVSGGQTSVLNLTLQYNSGRFSGAVGVLKVNSNPDVNYSTDVSYNTLGKITRVLTTYKITDPANPDQLVVDATYDSQLTLNGNNISVWDYTASNYPAHNNVPTVLKTIKKTFSSYDINKNPLALLPLPYTLTMTNEAIGSNALLGVNVNNYKKVEKTEMGSTKTSNYTYVYNADGFPISGSSENGTIQFEYQ